MVGKSTKRRLSISINTLIGIAFISFFVYRLVAGFGPQVEEIPF